MVGNGISTVGRGIVGIGGFVAVGAGGFVAVGAGGFVAVGAGGFVAVGLGVLVALGVRVALGVLVGAGGAVVDDATSSGRWQPGSARSIDPFPSSSTPLKQFSP